MRPRVTRIWHIDPDELVIDRECWLVTTHNETPGYSTAATIERTDLAFTLRGARAHARRHVAQLQSTLEPHSRHGAVATDIFYRLALALSRSR